MATMHREFDATQVEPGTERAADPNFTGWHLMQINASEWRPTKSNNGEFLELTVEVIDGKFKGRTLWKRMNLVNTSAKAVEIAERELSALCHAIGVLRPRDSNEMHGRPFYGRVIYIPEDGKGPAKNEIAENAYKPATGAAPTTGSAPAPTPAPATRTPWQKQPA